jgi:hypothetical protein
MAGKDVCEKTIDSTTQKKNFYSISIYLLIDQALWKQNDRKY